MAQHFLLSPRAKTLSLANIFQLSDAEAEATFRQVRWAETLGRPVCPSCQSLNPYDCRRPNGTARYRCRGCMKDFSITSGTLFASRKQPLKVYLAAIAIFCNELKGKSMLAMSRDLCVAYKTAFVLCHKIREAMASSIRERKLGGEGKIVEIDGAFFGGYVKPSNERRRKIDRRLLRNLSGKRRCVVIIREQQGHCVAGVFSTEGQANPFAASRIRKGSIIHADEAASWDRLQAAFKVKRINHSKAYSLDGISTNWAESFFSRMRRSEAAHVHISGPYLLRYAQEMVFREDGRRQSNKEQYNRVIALALTSKPSVDFCGYWQRSAKDRFQGKITDQYLDRSRSKPATSSHLASSPLVAPTRRIIPRFRILHRPLEAR